VEAVGNQLLTSKACFELFGYDFIVDSDYETWLIEVNTNPCLEESSPLLQTLIPRMVNDAIRLTVD
jgi:tubulin--tyrosine ligase